MTSPAAALRAAAILVMVALNLALANALRIAASHEIPVQPGIFAASTQLLPELPVQSYQPPPFESFAQTLARPVFSRDRRPYQPVLPAPPPPPRLPPPPPGAVVPRRSAEGIGLLGILMNGPAHRALLRLPSFPKGQWVNEGEEISGWILTLVAQDHAVLQAEGQKLELRLYRDPN